MTAYITAPLRPSDNKRYLVDSNGQPFLLVQDAAWSMGRYVSDADIPVYFADRQSRGFTGAIIEMIERQNTSDPTGVNFNGDTPFTGTTGGQPDFTTPRESFWQRVDLMVNTAKSYDIIPLAFPIYVGAVGGRDGWYVAMLANGSAKMQTYAQFLAARYGDAGIIWVVGGDLSPISTPTPMSGTALTILNDFATALHTALPNAIITAHWAGEDQGSSTKYGNADMHVINGVYRSTVVYDECIADYGLAGPIPVFGLEAGYSSEGSITDTIVRSQNYQMMTSGAFGITYGNGHVWPFDGPASTGPPWQAHLGDVSTQDVTRLVNVYRTLPWHLLVPNRNIVTAGGGTYGANTYVSLSSTPDRRWLTAYVPDAHTGSVTLDMSCMAVPCRGRWYDPRAGTFTAIGTNLSNVGTRAFTTPGDNAAGAKDWLLILDTNDFQSNGFGR